MLLLKEYRKDRRFIDIYLAQFAEKDGSFRPMIMLTNQIGYEEYYDNLKQIYDRYGYLLPASYKEFVDDFTATAAKVIAKQIEFLNLSLSTLPTMIA